MIWSGFHRLKLEIVRSNKLLGFLFVCLVCICISSRLCACIVYKYMWGPEENLRCHSLGKVPPLFFGGRIFIGPKLAE